MMRLRSLVIGLVAALVLPAGIAGASTTPSIGTDASGRVAAQAAVERVLWAHRIWPEANPGPKPSLEQVLPTSAIQAKVEDTLRMSVALERLAGRTISGADLQSEIDRQATHSRQPDVLAELWAALGHDPALVAETLARPVLVDRELRAWFAATHPDASFDTWWAATRDGMGADVVAPEYDYRLADLAAPAGGPGSWDPTHALPEANVGISAVWTGTEMIVWGGTEVGGSKFNSGSRYDPAMDTWRTTSGVNAPFPRKQHSAVWTGTEMIVWGGCGLLDEHFCQINSGGRYDPLTDTWVATASTGAPSARLDHTAVWTGTQMIVWGGCRFVNDACNAQSLGNSGGQYDPSTNSWQPTTTTGAPTARTEHTAVWTGSQMIVWGGFDTAPTKTGARYDPSTDTWTPTAANNKVPRARYWHTAVWTGSQMIVWGGYDGADYLSGGAIYVPTSNRWKSLSGAGAPTGRGRHVAVWTGSQMIVWGGCIGTLPGLCGSQYFNTGGRYTLSSNTWAPTSTANAPVGRADPGAVWTGSELVVWGGAGLGSVRTGGRYDPVADTWTPTNANEATSAREWHTAVWTGTEMIVWGGDDRFNGTVDTGGRYTLATDSWSPTAQAGAPLHRRMHTAVWTGTRMVVWGGQYGSTVFKTGGRYDPATNTWSATSTTGAPVARSNHTAVWTGTQMLVWGGGGNAPFLNTGGRYDPVANTWTAFGTTGAPVGRYLHSAVWTGSQMIVWGGVTSTGQTNTGGRYDPGSNSWTAISTTNAPTARYSNAAVWTGSQLLVWGGASFDVNGWTLYQTGGRYDPATNTWSATSTTGAPAGRLFFASVWTGSKLVVWGGCADDSTCGTSLDTGGEYSPATNSWAATPLAGAPGPRGLPTGVWTGTEMIVWGGSSNDSGTLTNTGSRYTPLA